MYLIYTEDLVQLESGTDRKKIDRPLILVELAE